MTSHRHIHDYDAICCTRSTLTAVAAVRLRRNGGGSAGVRLGLRPAGRSGAGSQLAPRTLITAAHRNDSGDGGDGSDGGDSGDGGDQQEEEIGARHLPCKDVEKMESMSSRSLESQRPQR